MAVAPPSLPPKSPRYVFLDAWRAIAALGVMIHHMINSSVMTETLKKVLPAPLLMLDSVATYRIPLFMIISGFVISHALRKNPLTKLSIGNFILRRHLRLDPAYWIMIVFMLVMMESEKLFPSLTAQELPTPKIILLNFLYLQNIFKSTGIVDVAWTLCIEFQFYLFFLLLMITAKYLSKGSTNDDFRNRLMLLVFGLGYCSLMWIQLVNNNAWFIQYWHYFALGSLCWAAIHHRQLQWLFFVFLGLTAIDMLFLPMSPLMTNLPKGDPNVSAPAMLISLFLSGLIFLVGIRGRLVDMWNWKPIQYIATISYSLYLVHLPVIWIVMRGGYKITGTNQNCAICWFILSGLASIGVAHIFYLLFERPSMRYAATFKAKSEARIPLPGGASETAHSGTHNSLSKAL